MYAKAGNAKGATANTLVGQVYNYLKSVRCTTSSLIVYSGHNNPVVTIINICLNKSSYLHILGDIGLPLGFATRLKWLFFHNGNAMLKLLHWIAYLKLLPCLYNPFKWGKYTNSYLPCLSTSKTGYSNNLMSNVPLDQHCFRWSVFMLCQFSKDFLLQSNPVNFYPSLGYLIFIKHCSWSPNKLI